MTARSGDYSLSISVYSHSAAETVEIGKKIGALLRPGDVIAYKGGLGAGKTTLTRGIAVGMGLRDDVSSPTFALVNEYRLPGVTPLFHFDMYRINGGAELESIGFFDYLQAGGVIAAEWSENISDELPDGTIFIEIERTGEEERKITIDGGERFDCIGD